MTPRDANALAGLRAARWYLWHGVGPRLYDASESDFICWAAKLACRDGKINPLQLGDTWLFLGAALGTKTSKTLMEWIAENGGAEWLETATDRDKQQVRHLWLEQLISDLEARG